MIDNRAIIDMEGHVFKTGGSNRYKETTFYPLSCHLLIKDMINNKELFSKTYKIKPSIKFEDLAPEHKEQYERFKIIHRRTWNAPGKNWMKVWEDIVSTIAECWVDGIYAKGKYLEERFLNRAGIDGETIITREWRMEKKDFHIIELNDFGIRKFDDYQYKRWKVMPENKRNWVMDLIIHNYEHGLPCPHHPKLECEYFMSELCKLRNK